MSDKQYDDEEYEDDDVENSAEDEYEEEYSDDAEASGEDAIDGTDEASDGDAMEHVEWGFEPKKRRFSKEVVIGLGAVSCLVGIFAFVAHNQLSGDGKEVAAINPQDTGPVGPDSDLGTAEDLPTEGRDPFDESGGGTADVAEGELPPDELIGFGSGEPPVLDDSGEPGLDNPLLGQTEPGFGGQPATGDAFERRDPFGSSPTEFPAQTPTGAAGTAGSQPQIDVAARDSYFGGDSATADPGNAAFGTPSDLSSDPFGTPPLAAESLPTGSGLPGTVDEFNTAGTEFGQPAGTLPDGDLLGDSSVGDTFGASPSLDEPFGSEPAVSLDTGLDNERPRGLFDSEPSLDSDLAGGGLAGTSDSTLDPGVGSPGSLGQPIDLGQPEASGFASDPATDGLPAMANDSLLSPSDPYGQPVTTDAGSDLVSPGLSNDNFLADPEPSGGLIASDALLSEPEPGTAGNPFGAPADDQFQQPIVGTQNDPLNGETLDASPGFDSPSGLESSVGSPATIVAQPEFDTSVSDSTYTVQENDSFWAISRKVYGTPKYFEALQAYNRSKVSDPKKLRPGMVLDTPSPSILADYLGTSVTSPQKIADGGRSEFPTAAGSLPRTLDSGRSSPAGLSGGILPVEPAAATQTVETTVASPPSQTAVSQNGQGGFFIGNQGYPMYRVAKGDTLTAIAADHLGRASRWKQIFRMNQDTLNSPNTLAPGVVLKLPGDASRVPLIDRTSSLR
ncbi:MAG: LysM peptidoglycan-binding domain-containing protein [Planctomycetota bacterium]|jgi:nucleoid-associated protein YgaU